MMKSRFAFGPYDSARGWLRGLGVALAAGLFLAFAGAFGTDRAPMGTRLAYWLALMGLGAVCGGIVARFFFRERPLRRPWRKALAAAMTMTVPFTVVVWLASDLAFGGGRSAHRLPVLFAAVFAISLIMVTINMLLEMSRTPPAPAASPTAPRFLERLPPKLRGAEIWAVEAEDHYLRLHTSKGQDLILMRMADAVAELEGVEGARVHRSWWVARDAVIDARRGDGRAVLTLKDDSRVPVSRTYAAALRERRWI